MAAPGSRSQRIWDDVIRTVIFIFGMSMAAFLLFRYAGWLSFGFSLIFLIAAGRNMRAAWFPYGKLIESLFWLGASSIGFIALLILWAAGSKEAATAALLIGVLVGYSIFDTYRSVRFILAVLKKREEEEANAQEEELPEDPKE